MSKRPDMQFKQGDTAGITAVGCPTCGGPCKVVTGDEGTSFLKPVRGRAVEQAALDAERVHRTENAARKLWEAATEHWWETEGQSPAELADALFDSSIAYPGIPIKGKELFRIGGALGFIDLKDQSEEGSG